MAARSAPGLDEARDLAGHGSAPGLALGEYGATVDGHRHLSRAAPANLRRLVKSRLELVGEAARLPPQVHSECAALDLDLHGSRFKHRSFLKASVLYPSTRRS